MSGDRFQPTADSGSGGGGGITQLTQDVLAAGAGSVPATVVGLRTRGISATAPTNGQVLAYNSGTGLWTPTTPTGGGASLYPALDSHDLGYWNFSEASGNFVNQGTAVGVDLVPSASDIFRGQASPLGRCVFSYISGTIESAAAPAIRPTAAASILLLIKPQYYADAASRVGVFGIADPTAPQWPFIIVPVTNDVVGFRGTGVWYANIKTTVSGYQGFTFGNPPFPDYRGFDWQQWNLIALTFDGSALKAYVNGGLVGSFPASGLIDYTGVGNTGIVAGGSASFPSWKTVSWLGYMRIRDVAMSADDIRLAYRKAMAWA